MAQMWPVVLDPDEIRDFGVDWTGPLNGAKTIDSSEWEVVSDGGGVTIDDTAKTTTTTSVRLTGGTVGQIGKLLNTVVLSDGERWQQTCLVSIQSR